MATPIDTRSSGETGPATRATTSRWVASWIGTIADLYRRTEVTTRVAVVLIVIYLLVVLIDAGPIGNIHTGDTDLLVRGAAVLKHCLGSGDLFSCGHVAGSRSSTIGPYALLQYLPAMGLLQLGLSTSQVVRALSALNFVAFCLCLVLVVLAAARFRTRSWSPILALALLGSSLTYQSTAGFGEMLGACAALAAITAVLWRRPWLIVITMALAATGKETLAPFILALGLLVGRRDGNGLLPPRRVTAAIVGGVVLGIALNTGLNLIRFGSVRNVFYLDPLFRTPGAGRKLGYLGAIWAAPSNGIAWYWPLFTVIVALSLFVACREVVRRHQIRDSWPALAAIGILVVFTAGLADWYTPFGWIAYGPRLAVPLLPAALVAIVYTNEPSLTRLMCRFLNRTFGVVLATAVAVLCIPQFGAPWSYLQAIQSLVTPSRGCAWLTNLVIQQGATRYYSCSHQIMWRMHPSVIWQATVAGGGVALAARVLLVAVSILLVLTFAHRVERKTENVIT